MVCLQKRILKDGTVKYYDKTKANKNYNLKNKEKLNARYNCPCGGKYTLINKYHHLKTKKHNKYEENKEKEKKKDEAILKKIMEAEKLMEELEPYSDTLSSDTE